MQELKDLKTIEKEIVLAENSNQSTRNDYLTSFKKLEEYLESFFSAKLFPESTLKINFSANNYMKSPSFGRLCINIENKSARFSGLADMIIEFKKAKEEKDSFLDEEVSYSSGSSYGRGDRKSLKIKLNALTTITDFVDYIEEDQDNIKELMKDVNEKNNIWDKASNVYSRTMQEKKDFLLNIKKEKLSKILVYLNQEQILEIVKKMKEESKTKSYISNNFVFMSYYGNEVKFKEKELILENYKQLSFSLAGQRISQATLKEELENVIMINGSIMKSLSELTFEHKVKRTSKMNSTAVSIEIVFDSLKKYITVMDF
jgi:hypothetical protein